MSFDRDFLKRLQEFADSSPWEDSTPMDEIVKASQKAFEQMCCEKAKGKVFYRLCGQSGSGKTSQLLVSILPNVSLDKSPVILAVREFVKYHPKYDELVAVLQKGELRERTNGFALKCLFLTLCKLLEAGYAILYDVTILEPVYEQMLDYQLRKHGYNQMFNILAVPKEQSTRFILKRQNDILNKEYGRIIAKTSEEYFYTNLERGLEYYAKIKDSSPAIVWTAYIKKPVFVGPVKDCMNVIIKYRKKLKKITVSEEKLLRCKQKFYKKYLVKKLGKNNV